MVRHIPRAPRKSLAAPARPGLPRLLMVMLPATWQAVSSVLAAFAPNKPRRGKPVRIPSNTWEKCFPLAISAPMASQWLIDKVREARIPYCYSRKGKQLTPLSSRIVGL
jgi:hypothetical protein